MQADLRLYRSEAFLASTLTDEERTELMRELYELFLEFQRGKDSDEIAREVAADRALNQGKLNPRYRILREQAGTSAEGGE